jgi:hypothetical protein
VTIWRLPVRSENVWGEEMNDVQVNVNRQLSTKYLVWAYLSLGMVLLLLTACRSSHVKVTGEITPEPIVGEIVTLRIEAVSEKYSGEGVIVIVPTQGLKGINILGDDLEWRGEVVAGEPFIYEVPICVHQPGIWEIYFQAAVAGIDVGENILHITSDTDSAQVIPSSEYKVYQPPLGSTPIPTPEPVTVSPECMGDN